MATFDHPLRANPDMITRAGWAEIDPNQLFGANKLDLRSQGANSDFMRTIAGRCLVARMRRSISLRRAAVAKRAGLRGAWVGAILLWTRPSPVRLSAGCMVLYGKQRYRAHDGPRQNRRRSQSHRIPQD